jgi:hypothetical protein
MGFDKVFVVLLFAFPAACPTEFLAFAISDVNIDFFIWHNQEQKICMFVCVYIRKTEGEKVIMK